MAFRFEVWTDGKCAEEQRRVGDVLFRKVQVNAKKNFGLRGKAIAGSGPEFVRKEAMVDAMRKENST